jgi:hypothetical protein
MTQTQTAKCAESLRALLSASIDYAGLFPPATLTLETALRDFAAYLRSGEAWMLGSFVLRVDKFSAAEDHLAHFDSDHLLPISALGKKTESAPDFLEKLAGQAEGIASWSQAHLNRVVIRQLEMALPPQFDAGLFVAIRSLVAPLKLQAFWEAPPDEAEHAIRAIADHNAQHPGNPLGYKLRTGGTVANAFPDTAKIARALVSATKLRVPIKFTAGLHHPVRHFHDSVQTKMHGFLNVLGAGVLATEHRWDEEQTATMLNDESPDSFTFNDSCFAWQKWSVPTQQIALHRKLVTSFGSCSFDEPRDDLRALGLL